jgi:hypothetical protein
MSQAPIPSRWLLLGLALALLGCSGSAARQDKQNVQKARSLLAEWAMLSESRHAGRLTATYYIQMRGEIEKQLTTVAATAPQSDSAAGQAIAEAAQVHGEPPVAMLRARVDAAKAIENSLEGR